MCMSKKEKDFTFRIVTCSNIAKLFFGNFVSDSHKQISFLVKYIITKLRTKKETTYKGQ